MWYSLSVKKDSNYSLLEAGCWTPYGRWMDGLSMTLLIGRWTIDLRGNHDVDRVASDTLD